MTAGVCWITQLNGPITAPLPHEQKTDSPEMSLSEQSVKEHNPSLLFMFDSHHQE